MVSSVPTTSIAAALAIAPSAKTLRLDVLRFIHSKGAIGATLAEIEIETGLAGNTVRPRRKELEEEGVVVDSGKRRLTPSGREAIVWVTIAYRGK